MSEFEIREIPVLRYGKGNYGRWVRVAKALVENLGSALFIPSEGGVLRMRLCGLTSTNRHIDKDKYILHSSVRETGFYLWLEPRA